MSRLRKYLPHALSALAAVLVTVGFTIVIDSRDNGPGTPRHTTVTITAKNAAGQPVKVTAPVQQVQQAASDGEVGLNHDTATPDDLKRDDQAANPLAPQIVGPVPLAAPNQPGCVTSTIGHNWSYRNGVRPSLVVLHLTVSPNVKGPGDVNSIVVFFNRPATQASSNYVIDAEGNCRLMVPESEKAWAQANFNSATACSLEVINTGNESTYAGTAGLAKIARIVHDCAHRWGIPLRRAAVSGSSVTRSGVLSHVQLGAVGGGHNDIHNFGAGCRNAGAGADTWKCVDVVIAAARALDGPAVKPVSKHARADCQELNKLRRLKRRTHGQGVRAQALKAALAKRYVCKVGPPGKITRR